MYKQDDPLGVDNMRITGRFEPLKICVGIATKGRPEQLNNLLAYLGNQTLAPHHTLICCTTSRDIGEAKCHKDVTILQTEAGSSKQRNCILNAIPNGTDIVVFFDDDFYPCSGWLEAVEKVFRSDKTIASITGHVVADGVRGPGLSIKEALFHIANHDAAASNWIIENSSPYGCNMAFRCSAIAGLRFDERLVLYGWLEDLDFGANLAKRGQRCIKLSKAFGAHLGIKVGRVSGRKFGYSQVMNPVYIYRKSSISLHHVVRQISRNFLINVVRSVRPESYVDRRGRLLGNLIAAGDLLRLRVTPERASSL